MNVVIKSVDKSVRRVVFNGNAIRRIETTANAAAASEKEGPDQSRKRKKLIVFGGKSVSYIRMLHYNSCFNG